MKHAAAFEPTMTIKPITKVPHAERSFYTRMGSPIVITLLIVMPLVLWGTMKAAQSNNNNIRQWLPNDLPEAATYDDFRRHFGADEFAIVSWDGATLDDPRLNHFAQAIIGYTTAHAQARDRSFFQVLAARVDSWITGLPQDRAAKPDRLFTEAITGPQVLEQLLGPPVNLSRDQALSRMEGILVGKDRRTSCVLLRLTDAGNNDRVSTLQAILQTTDRMGIPREQVHVGGEVVFNAVIDIESHAAIDRLTGLSGLAAIGLAFLSLRSIRLTIMVFVTALYAAGFAYASVHYAGGEVNLVLVVMPVLVYVTSISGCIHLTNYYKDAIRRHGLRGAPTRAIRSAMLPCALAATTTAVGLISLAVSHIQPVRSFGLFGAWGVLASLMFLFLLLPVLFERYPLRRLAGPDGESPVLTQARDRPTSRWLRRVARIILLWRRPLVAAFALLLIIAGAGVAFTETSVKTARFFPKNHPLVTDMRWLEQHIGPLVPIEIVIDFDNRTNKLNMYDRLELVAQAQMNLAAMEHVGGTISPATWAPTVETTRPDSAINPQGAKTDGGKADDALQDTQPPRLNPFALLSQGRRILINEALVANRSYFIERRYLSPARVVPQPEDADAVDAAPFTERWRITGRFEAFSELGYDLVLGQVREKIETYLASLPAATRAGVRASFTGAVPLVYAAQEELLAGLFRSFLMAFALIGVTMSILLGGARAGLVSMLPSIFPALVIFGFMGWLGYIVDVGAMLTASVAMGIAVDGTLHFLTWFKRSVREGMSKEQAIVESYARCAGALVQTTMITGLSMLVFFSTSFQPVAQFGLLMCLMLVAALIGSMILLPAVMGTRIGNLFMPRAGR